MTEPAPAATEPGVSAGAPLTRDCLDPWTYTEIAAGGAVRPCCNFRPLAELGETPDVGWLRNNAKFRALRQSLLDGKLDPICRGCHLRKSVPTDVLRRRVNWAGWRAGERDPLKPLPINFFRVDINEKCNLRCDYCAVSAPGYQGVEMGDELFRRVMGLLSGLAPGAELHVNGHGETTYHPQWTEWCGRIIERGFRPRLITNLAKAYSDAEIELLSRFAVIQVSLDSDDSEVMRKVRKAVRVDHVFRTIERIREAARRGKRKAPKLTFSIGVYDPSIWTLESFVNRLLREGAQDVTFWSLVEYPHQTLVRTLDRLDPQQTIRAREVLTHVSRRLDIAGVPYEFAGDFHGLLPKSTVADYVRKGLGFVYSFGARHLFSRPNPAALARRPQTL